MYKYNLTGRRWSGHHWALKNGDVAASAIAEHVFSCNHKVDLSKASVIDANAHTQTRCMLESWHIQHYPASLNRGKAPCQKFMQHCRTTIGSVVFLPLPVGSVVFLPPFTLDTIAISVLVFYHYYSRFSFSRHSLLYEHMYLTWLLQSLPAKLYLYIGACKC